MKLTAFRDEWVYHFVFDGTCECYVTELIITADLLKTLDDFKLL